MQRKLVTLFSIVGLVAVGLVIGLSINRPPGGEELAGSTGGVFLLSAPAFAQGSSTDEFPMNEAGISAYVHLGQELDLVRARAVFKGIEASEANYVIGIIELPNLAEDMWPHAYVSKSGWLMAYYPKTEPTSKLMQWSGYQRDVITTTTLKDTLIMMCQKMALDPSKVDSDMSYYHFQYPDATKLLIALDTVTDSTDDFQFTIPRGLSLYEASWSHYGAVQAHTWGDQYTESRADGTPLYRAGAGTYVVCRALEAKYTTPGSPHVIWIGAWRGWAGCAIVFLYN